MASNIDETIPADNVKVEKSDIRRNFQYAKEEIEEQQRVSSLPWQIATNQTSI